MSTLAPTAYIPIPASQPPPKQGYYHVIGGGEFYAFYHGGGLYPQNNGWDLPVTHWLKPVDLSKMLEDAWEASERRRKFVENRSGGLIMVTNYANEPADKETYINSVLNPPE